MSNIQIKLQFTQLRFPWALHTSILKVECFEIMTFARNSLWGNGTSLVFVPFPLWRQPVSASAEASSEQISLCVPSTNIPLLSKGMGKMVLTSRASCLQLVGQQKRDKWLLCVPVKMLLQSELSSRQWNSLSLYQPKSNIGCGVLQLCHKTPQLVLQKFSDLVGGLELLHCPGALSGAELH